MDVPSYLAEHLHSTTTAMTISEEQTSSVLISATMFIQENGHLSFGAVRSIMAASRTLNDVLGAKPKPPPLKAPSCFARNGAKLGCKDRYKNQFPHTLQSIKYEPCQTVSPMNPPSDSEEAKSYKVYKTHKRYNPENPKRPINPPSVEAKPSKRYKPSNPNLLNPKWWFPHFFFIIPIYLMQFIPCSLYNAYNPCSFHCLFHYPYIAPI